MKSVSKLTAMALVALALGVTMSAARAEDQSPAFPKQHMIDARAVTSLHQLNRAQAPVGPIDVVIEFNTNSSKLTPAQEHKVHEVAMILKSPAYKGTHVAVQGFTDSTGNDAHNQSLSYHRALQVMHTLVKKYGVPAGMLSAQGFGKENPVADNSTAEGRMANRRVSFAVVR
ncbi:MAG TPA: OmpA family protein [Alphaproteobacteria bacterium]|nr:OmpA family protein [Alphaproteobacteria bacterium]